MVKKTMIYSDSKILFNTKRNEQSSMKNHRGNLDVYFQAE